MTSVVEVRGQFADVTLHPESGYVIFEARPLSLVDTTTALLISTASRTAYLDHLGAFSVELVATDDPSLAPTTWTYQVQEWISGKLVRIYDIDVPLASAVTGIDLGDVAPVAASGGTPTPYVSSIAVNAALAAEAAARVSGDTTEATSRAAGDASTLSAATADAAGRYVRQRSIIYHDPSTKADGTIAAGAVLDSGQAVVNNVGTQPLRYSGGQLVHTAGSINATNAGYLQVQVPSGVVRRMSAQVAWAANALGAAAFVVPSALWNQSGGLLPVAGWHTTMYGNGVWVAGVWNPAPGQSGHVEAHMLNVGGASALTLSVTTTTPASTQATASLTVSTMTAATLKTALEGLSNVGAGKVTVVGPFGGKYGIVWDAALGVTTASISASTGTPAPTVTKYGTGVTTFADYTTNGRYATVWDGALRDIDTWLFPETAQAIIFFPDGTNSGLITDPGINLWCGAGYAVFELFENNSGTVDTPATYGRFAVDSLRQYPDAFAFTKPDVASYVASRAPVTLYEGANTSSVADITASGSLPPGVAYVEAVVIGGTSGGGSGACVNSGTAGNGGGAAGSAGIWREIIHAAAFAGATTYSVTVGRKGVGGAAVSTAGNGNNGTGGTLSKISVGPVVLQALAGGVGVGGTTGASAGAAGGAGGPFAGAGAAGPVNGAVGNNGAGVTATPGTPGSASGGGITTGAVANNGGVGGSNLLRGFTGGTAGVVGGAAPGPGTDATGAVLTAAVPASPGPGVGGGAASATGAAQAGATPKCYGVGGAGGGASLAPNASGSGGDGIGGYVLLRAHFL